MVNTGLCETCAHCKQLKNDRGSVFYMCRLAESRKDFLRYPRLPVLQCRGYELNRGDAEDAENGGSKGSLEH